MPGQNLPPVQNDGSVTIGQLSNGISYYLVTNSNYKGVADFALVMRGRPDTVTIRKELQSLPHFNKTSPYEFLSRNGVGCRPEGYISYPDGATLFRFDDVPVMDRTTCDSTLLMLFDIIASQPYQYAVIISGDINVQNLINRMSVFSMSIPKRNPGFQKTAYEWKPSESMSFGFSGSGRSTITLDLRSPRTPDNQMNTIQPFLTRVYVTLLRRIISGRVIETFADKNIVIKSLDTEYIGSGDTAGDEHFRILLQTAEDQQIQATSALASLLAELAKNGVTMAEYMTARGASLSEFESVQGNSEMVDNCVAAYLRGADLAKASTKINYITSRNLDQQTNYNLFNNFAKAFLDNPENICVKWTGRNGDGNEFLDLKEDFQARFDTTRDIRLDSVKTFRYFTTSSYVTDTVVTVRTDTVMTKDTLFYNVVDTTVTIKNDTTITYKTDTIITPGIKSREYLPYSLTTTTYQTSISEALDASVSENWVRETAFGQSWNATYGLEGLQYPWIVDPGDTMTFGATKGKTKIKSTVSDPVSGGEIWTLQNGVRVLFKNMASPAGSFSFSYLIRDGYQSVKTLQKGEGAFFSDMLWLYEIAGMPGVDFLKILRANGVDMNVKVSLSDMRIYGTAPSDKIKLVLKSILSVANDRTLNTNAFEVYKRQMQASLRTDPLDSLLFPNYKYTASKTVRGLVDNVQTDADSYFSREFAKMNDGMLVIIGDLKSENLQKYIGNYLGGLKSGKVLAGRPAIQYRYGSGDNVHSVEGDEKSIDIGMISAVPFTTENNLAFGIVSLKLFKSLSGAMAKNGFNVTMTTSSNLYPTESVELRFHCSPVPEEGLPLGIESGSRDPMAAVAVARKTISDVLANPIGGVELAAFKTLLAYHYEEDLSVPANYIEALLLRNSYGKDLITDYKNRIQNTTNEKVDMIRNALAGGMRIEYVVK